MNDRVRLPAFAAQQDSCHPSSILNVLQKYHVLKDDGDAGVTTCFEQQYDATMMRRNWIYLAALSALAAGQSLRAQPPSESVDVLYTPDAIDRAVKAGVEFLVKTQRADGAIADRGHEIAMTSLAIMAMAAIGTQPTPQTRTGRAMQDAIDFVLQPGNQDDEGYFGGGDQSRMYGHGITTLMLTEMLGMGAEPSDNERIHTALVKAIKLILASQAVSKPDKLAGGWRYSPISRDSDLSVSVWQLMALRSAKNDGLDVPGEAIEKAISYLRNSYTSPLLRDGTPRDKVSGFSYTPGTHHPTFTMTAAGLLAMQVCGRYDSPLVSGATQWLWNNPPKPRERFFHYGIYYYAQAMHQVGEKYSTMADSLVAKLLTSTQRPDGSWLPQGEERNIGLAYATALSVLSLSVRYHYLPIYQR